MICQRLIWQGQTGLLEARDIFQRGRAEFPGGASPPQNEDRIFSRNSEHNLAAWGSSKRKASLLAGPCFAADPKMEATF